MINRKSFKILLIILIPLTGYGQFTHIGPQVSFSTKVKEPGFGVQALYRVNDEIKLLPNALYYMPHKLTTADGTQKFDWWMINLDGNYVILKHDLVDGYGIMGLNFSNITAERDEVVLGQPFKDKQSLLKLGLNVGAGIRFNLGDKVKPFGELRYTLGSKADFTFAEVSTSQIGFYAGIIVRIAEDKERTATEDY